MKKKFYHKLVRDRIPEIITESGVAFEVVQLQGEDLTRFALKKLQEEVQEFIEDPSAEEGADIIEIFNFICTRLGIRSSEVKAQRLSKRSSRGGFDMGLLLEWVEDE